MKQFMYMDAIKYSIRTAERMPQFISLASKEPAVESSLFLSAG